MKKAQLALGLSVCMATAGIGVVKAQDLHGVAEIQQHQQYHENLGGRLWGKTVVKDLTLEPGFFQFSVNNLGMNDRLILNLVNPTDQTLQFETTRRPGGNFMAVVPPYSTRTISYIYNRLGSDENQYVVFQQPAEAVAQIQQQATVAVAPPVEAIPVVEQAVMEMQPEPAPPAQAVAPILGQMETEAAVRGYW